MNGMSSPDLALPYVLITPARNEEAFIEKTIQSVIRQTVLPVKWVIVDDGSTDSTSRIVNQYLERHAWIEMIEMPQNRERNFAKKVHCINAGYERVKGVRYEVIGNVDADISFEEDYFEYLLSQLTADTALGVVGTHFREKGYSSDIDTMSGQDYVTGACQVFRRKCFEDIGGYIPNKAGGIDWIAVTSARMIGWKTRSFSEKFFFHHRHAGTAQRGALVAAFLMGEKDYYLGGHPAWEIFRVFYRMAKQPYLFGGLMLGFGYAWALLRRIDRPVSDELMKFHRKEQLLKLKKILRSLLNKRA